MFGGLLVALGALFYLPMTLLAPLREAAPVVPVHSELPGEVAVPVWPGYGASAIGAVGFPGVLAASGSDQALPMASITKIVTALTVLQAKPLAVGEAGPDGDDDGSRRRALHRLQEGGRQGRARARRARSTPSASCST